MPPIFPLSFFLTSPDPGTTIRNMSNFEQEELERITGIFKALANPNRLKILMELTRCDKGCTGFFADQAQAENCQQEFATMLGLAPSTVSHHFKELRNAGLLTVWREGKAIRVQVNQEVLAEVRNLF